MTKAAPVEQARIADAMHHGVVTMPASASLVEVATVMFEQRIHSVVVDASTPEHPDASWSVVSDLDLVAAAFRGADLNARDIASTPAVTAHPEDPLLRAAELMNDHQCGHVIVVDASDGAPVGVISTLDVAGQLARAGAVDV